MAAIQPGLARIMPEIGARTWKLYYAAKLANWPMAKFQYKEIIGLFEMGAFMRPKHEAAINQYLAENWKPLEETIAHKDFAGFERRSRRRSTRRTRTTSSRRSRTSTGSCPTTPPPGPRSPTARRVEILARRNSSMHSAISLTRDASKR